MKVIKQESNQCVQNNHLVCVTASGTTHPSPVYFPAGKYFLYYILHLDTELCQLAAREIKLISNPSAPTTLLPLYFPYSSNFLNLLPLLSDLIYNN